MRRVSLKEVVKAMDAILGDIVVLFDKKNNRFLYIPKQFQDEVNYYLHQEHIVPFIRLEDIPFVEIREQFIETLSGNMKAEFIKQFRGQYRFKKFKEALTKYHQWEEFRSFQTDKYYQIARIWCESQHIHYI